jgi:3-dehydroquinate dehydratase
MKIRSVTTELFHAEGRLDITKIIVSFHNFAKVPKGSEINKIQNYSGIWLTPKINKKLFYYQSNNNNNNNIYYYD